MEVCSTVLINLDRFNKRFFFQNLHCQPSSSLSPVSAAALVSQSKLEIQMFSLSLNLACVSSYMADSRSSIAKTLKLVGLVSPNNRYPCTTKPAATLTDLKTLRTPTQILSKRSFDAVARESGVYSRLLQSGYLIALYAIPLSFSASHRQKY